MNLTIKISLDNAAFQDSGIYEIERILTDISDRLPDPLRETNGELSIHDINGNYVGHAEISA